MPGHSPASTSPSPAPAQVPISGQGTEGKSPAAKCRPGQLGLGQGSATAAGHHCEPAGLGKVIHTAACPPPPPPPPTNALPAPGAGVWIWDSPDAAPCQMYALSTNVPVCFHVWGLFPFSHSLEGQERSTFPRRAAGPGSLPCGSGRVGGGWSASRSIHSGLDTRQKHGGHLPISPEFISAPGRSRDGQPAGHGNL